MKKEALAEAGGRVSGAGGVVAVGANGGAVLTLADIWRPSAGALARLYDAVLVLGGSLLVAVAAQIHLPLLPVPATAQTFAVMLLAMALGSRRAVACILAYLMEGAIGLPVFAGGGAGVAVLAGPTGGYLFGFVAAAWVTGSLADRGWDRRAGTTMLAMVLGLIPLYLCGVAWLSLFMGIPGVMGVSAYYSMSMLQVVGAKLGLAVATGLLPFLPLALVKIALAAVLLPRVWRLVGSRPSTPDDES